MDIKTIYTPVLLLVFNKPEKTRQVFEVIKKVKPKKLYVAADAPRKHVLSDFEQCQEVRKIVSEVDWECEFHTLFHEDNLGCSLSGFRAWDWFFSQEEEMIFLEDDGVASISFFTYCQELLEKYRNDKRIAYISAVNYDMKYGDNTYFFSRYEGGSYGMATWKRVHELYEYKLETYDDVKNSESFLESFHNKLVYKARKRKFENYINYGGNTYDVQFLYLLHKYDMYCINPNINLVTDIGWDADATNLTDATGKMAKKYANKPRFEIDNIKHPEEFYIDPKFEDKYIRERVFYGKSWTHIWLSTYFSVIFKIINKIMKILNLSFRI